MLRPFKDDAPREATGLAFDYFGRGPLYVSTVFMGPALLKLAAESPASAATATLMGMKPAAVLTNISAATGILTGLSMPVVGAVMDHTPHRRAVGTHTAWSMVLLGLVQLLWIDRFSWPLVAVAQVLGMVICNVHAVTAFAYNADLSPDPQEQSRYNGFYQIMVGSSRLFYVMAVMCLAGVMHLDTAATARVAQGLAVLVSGACFSLAWPSMFRECPPTATREQLSRLASAPPSPSSSSLSLGPIRTMPNQAGERNVYSHAVDCEGCFDDDDDDNNNNNNYDDNLSIMTLCRVGFAKTWETYNVICTQLPALKRLILAVMWTESALMSLLSVSVTFCVDQLLMSPLEIGLLNLISMCFAIAGAACGQEFTQRTNPLVSNLFAVSVMLVVTYLASLIMTGPADKLWAYVIGAAWGALTTWILANDITLFVAMSPVEAHSTTEYMGLYVFAGSIGSWIPPLLFSFLVQIGAPLPVGLVAIDLLFLLGLGCYASIGNFKQAVAEAKQVFASHTTTEEEGENENDATGVGMMDHVFQDMNDNTGNEHDPHSASGMVMNEVVPLTGFRATVPTDPTIYESNKNNKNNKSTESGAEDYGSTSVML